MTKFLPRLTQARNEVVAWVGLVVSVLSGFVVAASEIDMSSTNGVMLTVGPAVSALIGRANAYGPVSYDKSVAAARNHS